MKWFLILLIGLTTLQAEELSGETWRVFEETVAFDGIAQDDFFALANEVHLGGDFRDDVWAAARKISFSGKSEEDVRLFAAELLSVDGEVGGNLRAMASIGNLALSTNAVVKGHAILQAGKRITVNGRIEGDLRVQAPEVGIEAEIMGNLSLFSPKVQLLPGTIIHGDLFNQSGQDLPIPDGVTLMGERKKISVESSRLEKDLQQFKWALLAMQFLSAYLIGLMLLRLLPRFTGQNVDLILHHRNPTLTIGLLSFLIFSISGYFMLASIIGSGVGIFLLLITGLGFYLGKIMVAYALGLVILRQKTDLSFGKLALALFIGLVMLYTVFNLVYIGDALYFMSSCWGLGAMLTSLRNSQRVIKFEVPPPLKQG
jgi:cytoskeletal protein CcmA (bactofilin family)